MSNTITIYHNPNCTNSKRCLHMIREHLEKQREKGGRKVPELRVIEYLKTPLGKAGVAALIERLKETANGKFRARDLIRVKEPVFDVLFGWDARPTDAECLDAMAAHPILMNRPIVTTSKGTKLCRPPTLVEEML